MKSEICWWERQAEDEGATLAQSGETMMW